MDVAILGGGTSSKFIFATKKKVVTRAMASLWAGYCFDWKIRLFFPNELIDPLGLELLEL